MKRFRGGLAFKAHRLYVSLNSWLESNKEGPTVARSRFRTEVHCTCRPISPYSGRDCVKSHRSSYTGLYPQISQNSDASKADQKRLAVRLLTLRNQFHPPNLRNQLHPPNSRRKATPETDGGNGGGGGGGGEVEPMNLRGIACAGGACPRKSPFSEVNFF